MKRIFNNNIVVNEEKDNATLPLNALNISSDVSKETANKSKSLIDKFNNSLNRKMYNFAQFLPRIKAVVTQEAWNKSKVILQHFSNINENVKNESEQVLNIEDQATNSLDNAFKNFEVKSEESYEIPSTAIVESLKRFEIKPAVKESIVNKRDTSIRNYDDTLKNIDIKTAINSLGKGVESNWKITRPDFFNDDNLEGFDPELPKALDECKEDVSHIGPVVKPTVTFASIANKSVMMKELCKLGVDFYKIEKEPANVKFLMSLDYEKNIKPYIQFLNDCYVEPSDFGKIITKNPKLFGEDLEDLQTRIRYLRAHAFSKMMIARIITVNPFWLLFNTRKIDERLGYFQYEFKLTGNLVRKLAVKSPDLITYNMKIIKENTFAVKEEMGFDLEQTRTILLKRPVLWMYNRYRTVSCFDYVHNKMNIPHEMIVNQPDILLHRKRRVQNRHMFLKELNKAQYNPTEPNYVSLISLVEGNDMDFCANVAKTSIDTYNTFLKTL